jgi:hypothetical protein
MVDSDLARMREFEQSARKELDKNNITIGEFYIIKAIMFVARMVWKKR